MSAPLTTQHMTHSQCPAILAQCARCRVLSLFSFAHHRRRRQACTLVGIVAYLLCGVVCMRLLLTEGPLLGLKATLRDRRLPESSREPGVRRRTLGCNVSIGDIGTQSWSPDSRFQQVLFSADCQASASVSPIVLLVYCLLCVVVCVWHMVAGCVGVGVLRALTGSTLTQPVCRPASHACVLCGCTDEGLAVISLCGVSRVVQLAS